MSATITYEQPLNERIRTFLRLEFLFARVDKAMQFNDELSHRDAIDAMLNILSVFERNDLFAFIFAIPSFFGIYLGLLHQRPF